MQPIGCMKAGRRTGTARASRPRRSINSSRSPGFRGAGTPIRQDTVDSPRLSNLTTPGAVLRSLLHACAFLRGGELDRFLWSSYAKARRTCKASQTDRASEEGCLRWPHARRPRALAVRVGRPSRPGDAPCWRKWTDAARQPSAELDWNPGCLVDSLNPSQARPSDDASLAARRNSCAKARQKSSYRGGIGSSVSDLEVPPMRCGPCVGRGAPNGSAY
jgi:hypothetical protein